MSARRRRSIAITFFDRAIAFTRRYVAAVRCPLYALAFVLPLVLAYEIGMMTTRAAGGGDALVSHGVVQSLFKLFGAQGVWLPGLLLLVTLLTAHVLGRDSGTLEARFLALMPLEASICSIPLFIITALPIPMEALDAPLTSPARFIEALGDGAGSSTTAVSTARGILLAIGAGLFEELVFRLYLLVGFQMLFADVLRLSRTIATILAIALSSYAFAACHVQPIGVETFALGTFAARFIAGAYLCVVFMGRGMGIAVGSHVIHNVTLVLTASGGAV